MEQKYIKFFDTLPTTVRLNIRLLVPSKYKQIDTNMLSCVLISHGSIKRCVVDNLKSCADKVINSVVKQVGSDDKKIYDFEELELTDECKIFIENFNYFTNSFKDKMTSEIMTAYVSYLLMTDTRLLSYKFFDDCLYVNEKDNTKTELYNIIKNSLSISISAELEKYGKYMIDPLKYTSYSCFGRDNEIEQSIDILSRLNKNNLILVGNPGVGKTCIVEGICNYIQSDKCPDRLRGSYIFQLDGNALISGTMYRGDLEKRLQDVLCELSSNPNIILFIDEIHTMLNKPSGENGSTSIQNVLKPYLCNGLKVIGCTTEQEYLIVEKDKAFERRFSKVLVKELSKNKTAQTLKLKKIDYEEFHNISIDMDICDYIVEMCSKYIKNRYFPDKAFDVLDTACVLCKKEGKNELDKESVNLSIFNLAGIKPKSLNIEYLNEIENEIKQNIIGQDNAITTVIRYIKKYYVGLNNQLKPIASLLFVGPTGTGKTELCKQIANKFFTPESFIRFDMSEFMEPHSVSKIIGAPPGYIGHDNGGCLTQKVKHNPFSIILFDEIEKAHKDVINILLQIMDDGRITDSFGDTIDFCNTVIIMTSNIGCKQYLEKGTLGFASNDNSQFIKDSINDYFSPEFRNRLDEIIYFNRIEEVVFKRILEKELAALIARYQENCNVTIIISDNFVDSVYPDIYDDKNGVRFIKNKLAELFDTKVLNAIISNNKIIRATYLNKQIELEEVVNEKPCA